MTENCMTCRFRITEVSMQSFCRRNPPTVFFNPKNGQLISALPPISPEKQWCGEYQASNNNKVLMEAVAMQYNPDL